ncbi:MAG: HAMP domain-containing histidine kinase [Gammaproteobacteria bacterium]|nr:two-component sensor histidine kinase [Gammaproteobacteria bacterium]
MRLPALFRTTIFQLTLVYMALFGASVLALFTFIYWSTLGYLERQTQQIIEAEIRGLAEQVERRGIVGLADVITERVRRDTERRSIYLLVDAALRPIAGNVARWPERLDRRGEWVVFLKAEGDGGYTPVRALVLGVGPGFRLLVGRDVRELEQINEVFRRASVWGLGLTMGLSLLGGLLIGFSAQRRLAQINRTTRQIIAGNLSQRVPVTGGGDEHDELAENLNAMLDQIEKLMAGLRHVGDSVAHDLRSPLTRLRTRLETLANAPNPSREDLEACVAQADALLATFNALLRIARIESGAYRSAFAPTDLGRIARDVCELYQAAADERGIALSCEAPDGALVIGDRELLAQALTNLLDNAVKYTPDGGRIDVEVTAAPRSYVLSVADTGPGIPAHERERMLERFTRLDSARSLPGNGLGLALVKAVAEQHDGRLTLGDRKPGLIVELELPAAATSAETLARAEISR